MKIEGFLSNVHQLDRSTTFRVLLRFQNVWYLFCLARSETFENGNYNSEIDDLPTLSGVTVKRFSGNYIFSIVTQNRQPPNFGELEKIFSGEEKISGFFFSRTTRSLLYFPLLYSTNGSLRKKRRTSTFVTPPLRFFLK